LLGLDVLHKHQSPSVLLSWAAKCFELNDHAIRHPFSALFEISFLSFPLSFLVIHVFLPPLILSRFPSLPALSLPLVLPCPHSVRLLSAVQVSHAPCCTNRHYNIANAGRRVSCVILCVRHWSGPGGLSALPRPFQPTFVLPSLCSFQLFLFSFSFASLQLFNRDVCTLYFVVSLTSRPHLQAVASLAFEWALRLWRFVNLLICSLLRPSLQRIESPLFAVWVLEKNIFFFCLAHFLFSCCTQPYAAGSCSSGA
jgi:hypothetical protein